MKKHLPWFLTATFAIWILSGLRPKAENSFHTREFGQLPVLLAGRLQPFDSVARNSLLQFRARQSVADPGGTLSAMQWLLEVMMTPELANERKSFRIDHPDLLALLRLSESEKYFSLNQLKPALKEIEREGRRIEKIPTQRRTTFERQTSKLFSSLVIYSRLQNSLCAETSKDFAAEVARFQELAPAGIAAMQSQANPAHDHSALGEFSALVQQITVVKEYAWPFVVPPPQPAVSRHEWVNVGVNLLDSVRGTNELSPAVTSYAAMTSAFRKGDPAAFNRALAGYHQWLRERFAPELARCQREARFNDCQPFYRATVAYVFALVLALVSTLTGANSLRRSAFNLVALAWIVHTAGLTVRMLIEGRPPVTNLYSSAIFIGWGAVLLGLILERVHPIGIGLLAATVAGFTTQIVAHNLALGGETIEVMRAVLDTNFWLATHVVVVTLGYSATFVAGALAAAYILLGLFTPVLAPTGGKKDGSKSLGKMVHAIICFAMLFSFAGTVLGGIWADQSWGRFWGWDPKENGALLLVLWNAVILHARVGKLVQERGLMIMAVMGNIVTAFSWFGVNMLGVGLHSYGFMDSAFKWLILFGASQLFIAALGLLPLAVWKSFRQSHQEGHSASFPKPLTPAENSTAAV